MKWIWEQVGKSKTPIKLVIWEDWQGRQIAIPDADLVLYYNPQGGKAYHRSATCYSASGKTFSSFSYGELENEHFKQLTRCDYCGPPRRETDIRTINNTYAPGCDHDPLLTSLRQNYLEMIRSIGLEVRIEYQQK